MYGTYKRTISTDFILSELSIAVVVVVVVVVTNNTVI